MGEATTLPSLLTSVIAGVIFVSGYAFITLEHRFRISKSAIALMMGALLWMLAAFVLPEAKLSEGMMHTGADVFEIVIFLLAAMSLVEVLIHYKLFDVIRGKLFALGLTERQQFVAITFMTFLISAFVDNLTTTIVMIQIARKFFRGDNLVSAAGMIVLAANAGGTITPIGDVTTIMLWLGGKFTTWQLMMGATLPALVLVTVALLCMYPRIKHSTYDGTNEIITKLGRSEWLIISVVCISFILPLFMGPLGLRPYMGRLIGLGLVWILVDALKSIVPKQTHLDASIEEFIKKSDIPSLKFFVGILLAVAALNELGVLQYLADFLYGAGESVWVVLGGNVGLGLLSALLDNVPLTAIALEILHTSNTSLWVLLALTVGTGGSLLSIGSAAGIVAMGMVPELTFMRYVKIVFVPGLLGFFACIGMWILQYFVFGF